MSPIEINKFILVVISCLLQTIITKVSAQNNITVNQLPIMDKLPSNSVHRVYEDKEGYIWFGTPEGLCRYDGYRIKTFRSDINSPNLLTCNEISCIAEDNNHNLWIGTNEGLNILNKNTYEIIPLPNKNNRHLRIKDILVAKDSTIWVGAENIIERYNPDLSIRNRYYNNPDDSTSIPKGLVNGLFEDSYNNIWLTLWTKGLHKYNSITDKFIPFPEIGETNNPFRIFQDKQNKYWIGTWDDGLYLFNPNSNNQTLYHKINVFSKENNREEKTFFSFAQDNADEYIWVMSLFGLHAFKYNSNAAIEEVDLKNTLKKTNNIFSEIIKDKEGNLWIGAFSEGVFKINFNQPIIENFPINAIKKDIGLAPSFTSLLEDSDGDIWVNQNRFGLCVYSPTKKDFKLFTDITSLKQFKDLKYITNMNICGKNNEIWISNSQNSDILRIRKKNGKIKSIEHDDLNSLFQYPGIPQDFHTDQQGNIWIGTSSSLFIKQQSNDSIKLVKRNIGSVTDITQDTNDNIWISTSDKGLFSIKRLTNLNSHYEVNKIEYDHFGDHIQSLAADHSGNICIGTKEGRLFYYDSSSNQFTERTLECGLRGEAILDILIDKFNHLWISTYKNVIEFNPENMASFPYNYSDDIQVNSFLKGSKFITKDSERIYFGGNRGYSCFKPTERLKLPTQQTEVKITDIKIQNESILQSNKLSKYSKRNNTLTLLPEDKHIEFYFSVLDYNNPKKIKYSYKLSGIDNDWVYVKKDRQFAVYSQLKKGEYTLYIKATDAHNLWSNQITKLHIIRKAALYETNAAFVFYIIIIASVISILIYIMLSRLTLRNKVKMIQFEKNKTEELTQLKLKYFTNISHDLLTPLTIISCLIDDIETTSNQKFSQFSIMRSNIVRLKRLLQQILDFRRVENGKMQLRITNADIVSFIKDICFNHFLPIFNKKHIHFTFDSPQKEIKAYFDADKIDKVLFNLLSNAFKFTPENGSISISLSSKKENNHSFLYIKVSDSGIGINSQNLDKIFTRFYYNDTLNASETHGIGLSLSKDLIELHHGKISVKSEPNMGTTFEIKIPIDKKSYSITEIATNSLIGIYESLTEIKKTDYTNDNSTEQTISHAPSGINILVVDDNSELLQLMKQLLSRSYHILTATNGFEAMEVVKTADIDIIVSDVMMPEMDGIEFCKLLKGNIETSHISVILLTAKNSINDRIECYNAGADAYISKPFEMKVLEARINNFVSHKREQQKEFKSNAEINISSLEYPSMDEQFLKNAVELIEKNLSETLFDINRFADELNLSKSSLYRKIKTITGLAPVEFIRNIKLKHASIMLKKNSISISEVAYAVGFSDPKYFSSCFKAEFNITPSEYQKQRKYKESVKE